MCLAHAWSQVCMAYAASSGAGGGQGADTGGNIVVACWLWVWQLSKVHVN